MTLFRIYLRVLTQLGPERRLGIWLAIANLGLATAQFAEPVLFGRIIDALSRSERAGQHVNFGELRSLVLVWITFGLFSICAGVLIALHADRLAHRRRVSVMADYFEHALSLPLSFHLTTHSGRLLKAMLGGADSMSWLWLGFFREQCATVVALLVLLPLTVFLNAPLGGLLVVLVLFFCVLTVKVARRTQTLQAQVTHHHTKLAEHTSDALANVPVIQSFTRVEAELRELKAIGQRLLEAQIPVLSWWAIAAVATRAAATLTVTGILLLGAWLITQGKASVGELVTFMSLATMLIGRLDATVGFVGTLFIEAPKMRELFTLLDTTPSVRDRPDARDVARLSGSIRFDDVHFSYDPKRRILDGLSFEVEPGETVALVGASGSGKSTTLSLLYRAFDPQQGRILADGLELSAYTLHSLRRNIAVVFQEPMLFARSIRENLLVGKPDATDAEIQRALERAQAWEMVQEQPEGLDTVLGERGRSLSGGERQRLSIARALLKNPPILILDEATAALDAETERKVKLALDEVMRERTTFVIAHRLATVRDASRILVFEQGHVVESGGFAELAQLGGRFSELVRAQVLDAPKGVP